VTKGEVVMNSMSFEDIMRQMQQQVQQESVIFGADPNNPFKLTVENEKAIFGRELNAIERNMLQTIMKVDNYSWQRGKTGGLKTGFDLFDEGLEGGLQPGLLLFAAQPNVGKSAFMLQIGKNVSRLNENVHVAYFSLDDSLNELMPRWIACDQRIKISQAKNPERFMDDPAIMEKRNEGLKNLYRSIDRFSMYDTSTVDNSVESIEDKIKELLMTLPEGTKLVIMIDSFHDLISREKEFGDNSKALHEYTAKYIKNWCTTYDAVVCCTAHLRKVNGNKRPDNADLKETNRLEYEANWIGMMYNEVGVKEESAQVYWLHEDSEEKMPVLEVRFAKNKFGSFKGTRFYEFWPDQSYAMEATIEDCRRYSSLIHQA